MMLCGLGFMSFGLANTLKKEVSVTAGVTVLTLLTPSLLKST